MKGVWNKILRVHLSEKKVTTQDVPDEAYGFSGRRGAGGLGHVEGIPVALRRLPARRLTFATGPMQGIKQSGAAKWAVGGISPPST